MFIDPRLRGIHHIKEDLDEIERQLAVSVARHPSGAGRRPKEPPDRTEAEKRAEAG